MNPRHPSLNEFSELLDTYGADQNRWPPAKRAMAQAVLAQSQEAHELLRRAHALDELLALDTAPEPRPELFAAVAADAQSPRPATWKETWSDWKRALWPFGPIWQPVAAMGLAACLGLVAGGAVLSGFGPAGSDTGDADDATTLAFGSDFGLSEVAEQ